MDLLTESIVMTMDSSLIKRIENPVPAHWKYWKVIGFARRWDRDTAEVQVFGLRKADFIKPVAIRR